jgi:hypothetical protein
MRLAGSSRNRRFGSVRGFAKVEVLVTVILGLLGGIISYNVSQITSLGETYQADYRTLREKIEATNVTITNSLHAIDKEHAEFKATTAAKIEKLSDAVAKSRSR